MSTISTKTFHEESHLIHDFLVQPETNISMLARQSGLYHSRDAGKSWTSAYNKLQVNSSLPTLSIAVTEKSDTPYLFAGTTNGLLRSIDGGLNWESVFSPDPLPIVTCISLFEYNPQNALILAGTLEDGIYSSLDWGETWQSANFGLIEKTIFCMKFSPHFSEDKVILAGTHSGIFRSTNAGRSWHDIIITKHHDAILSLAIASNNLNPITLFAGNETGQLFRSDDNGTQWHEMSNSDFTEPINDIVTMSSESQQFEIYILCGTTLILLTDELSTWKIIRENVAHLHQTQQYLWAVEIDGTIIKL